MKRYIRSYIDIWRDADMSRWSPADVDAWEMTDWKDRNYEPLKCEDDTFEGELKIYGIGRGPVTERVTFIKEIDANPIFSPTYTVKDFKKVADKYSNLGYDLVSPMYDGTTHSKDGIAYKVMDRAETYKLYDMLSR